MTSRAHLQNIIHFHSFKSVVLEEHNLMLFQNCFSRTEVIFCNSSAYSNSLPNMTIETV